ncbi:unnamed protein product [Calypogeia fissa]
MESSAPTASPSLKKLKREAAQRRKAQARSLKLRADEQERLQRLEIDALVEQQRLQRLERQRCEELAAARVVQGLAVPSGGGAAVRQVGLSQSHDGKCKTTPNNNNDSSNHKSQQQQQQQQRESNSRGGGGTGSTSCMSDGDHQHSLHKSKAGLKNCGSDAVGIGAGDRGGGGGGGWRGKDSQRSKHAQQQSMRAAVESRRRLARGPRSGVVADAHPTQPSEDHRVVSTEYQAAGTQALMRVTLLAAGFVIGARGISARLIGQVTGAIVQSWTESCRPDAVPIRLFRIQGKKAVVQAAVALIGQAVAKYKDLCDCKRRGEFVQREHIINGVEFYYQPPPRKAFALNAPDQQQQQQQQQACCSSGGGKSVGGAVVGTDDPPPHGSTGMAGVQSGAGSTVVTNPGTQPQLSFTPHHVWLQHLHAQQHQKQQQQLQNLQEQQQQQQQQQLQEHQQQQQQAVHELQQAATSGVVAGGMVGENRSIGGRPQPGFFDWRSQAQQQQPQPVGNSSQARILQGSKAGGDQDLQQKEGSLVNLGADSGAVVDSRCTSSSELERIDQGLQQSVASLEQALQQVRLEQRLLQHNRAVTEIGPPGGGGDNSRGGGIIVGNNLKQQQQLQMGSERVPSLWAEVGIGGHERAPGFPLGSSLFSIFGTGELPLPVSSSHVDGRSSDATPTAGNALGLQQLNSSMASSTTGGPFDFPRCDFLRESLHAFPFAPARDKANSNSTCNGSTSEYSLYGHSKNVVVGDPGGDSSLCIVCLEQPAGVRLMACGHTSFCLACVQGLVNCPLCREKIVGLHQCSNSRASSSPAAGVVAGVAVQQRGGSAVAAKLNGSSYHLWNWVPGASV